MKKPKTYRLTIDVRGLARLRLFVTELTALRDDMRVAGSPHAERLERAIDRFAAETGEDIA